MTKWISVPTPQTPATDYAVLGSITTIQQTLSLAGHQYFSLDDTIDALGTEPLRSDTQCINIKFAPRSGWAKGQNALWEEIIAGSQDAALSTWATQLNAISPSRRLVIACHHEPVLNGNAEGTPANLALATRYFINYMRTNNVTHFMGQCFLNGQWDQFPTAVVPDIVDFVGCDAYGKVNQPTAAQTFAIPMAKAQAFGKPMVIFETNMQSQVAGAQASYYNGLRDLIKANSFIIGCFLWPSGDGPLNAEGIATVTDWATDTYFTRVFV